MHILEALANLFVTGFADAIGGLNLRTLLVLLGVIVLGVVLWFFGL